MRLSAQTVRLGAHQWQVRPLTLAQVQAIEPIVQGAADAGSIAAAIGVLRVALGRDHAEAAATLEEIEAPAPQIAAAMAVVLRLGGFLPGGDAAPGEAGAGSPPASIGAGSTPV